MTAEQTNKPTEKSKYSNVQRHATEKAHLVELFKLYNEKAKAMQSSLDEYLTDIEISTAYTPKNIESLSKVLDRFLKQKKISDIFELVGKYPKLLDEAIAFAKNPTSENENRAIYNQAERDLKTIKNNLLEYSKLDTKSKRSIDGEIHQEGQKINARKDYTAKVEVEESNHDGFKVYVERAKKISDFVTAFEELRTYTKGTKLDPDSLPKTTDALKGKLLIAPPKPVNVKEEGDIPLDTEENATSEPSYDDSEFYELGSDTELMRLNKNAIDAAVRDVTLRKEACFKTAIEQRIEYNQCSYSQGENADIKCAPIQFKYETGKANCENHFPMVVIADAIREKMFEELEKVHVNEQYIVDTTKNQQALGSYLDAVGYVASQNIPLALPGVEYNTGAEQAAGLAALKNQTLLLVAPEIVHEDL